MKTGRSSCQAPLVKYIKKVFEKTNNTVTMTNEDGTYGISRVAIVRICFNNLLALFRAVRSDGLFDN